MSFTNYTESAMLNSLFGKTSDFGALASAPTIHVALFTSAPNDSGGGAEASYTGYSRVATAPADWNASAGGSSVDNANAITFGECTAGSESITHFALFDAASAGNMLAYGALNSPLAVSAGIAPEFLAGNLDTSLD